MRVAGDEEAALRCRSPPWGRGGAGGEDQRQRVSTSGSRPGSSAPTAPGPVQVDARVAGADPAAAPPRRPRSGGRRPGGRRRGRGRGDRRERLQVAGSVTSSPTWVPTSRPGARPGGWVQPDDRRRRGRRRRRRTGSPGCCRAARRRGGAVGRQTVEEEVRPAPTGQGTRRGPHPFAEAHERPVAVARVGVGAASRRRWGGRGLAWRGRSVIGRRRWGCATCPSACPGYPAVSAHQPTPNRLRGIRRRRRGLLPVLLVLLVVAAARQRRRGRRRRATTRRPPPRTSRTAR